MEAYKELESELQRAVIYCRVSGKKQSKEGSGLGSQEYRCRQYAESKGYIVEEVFPDEISGGGDFAKRKGMVKLLRYLDEHSETNFVVIFDDLKRYARDVEFHLKLRRLMHEHNAVRECLNFNFENSPEGKLNETVTAAAGAYERESMARQNRQKSIARIEQGYAVLSQPPVGYKYIQSAQGGKVLVKEEPYASIVKEALEGFASGRFASQAEVTRFVKSHANFPKSRNNKLTQWRIVKLLRQKLYAGYVESPGWGISARKGNHEALISYQTHKTIIDKLDAGVYAPMRKDIKDDFPLRGAISCGSCCDPLTAGWSQGKSKKYPYYRCKNKDCDMFGKGIARDKLETEFAQLLAAVQPSNDLVAMASAMFKQCWEILTAQGKERNKAIRQQLNDVEIKIEQLVNRAVTATNPRVIAAYEKNIETLEEEKLILTEKLENQGRNGRSFEGLFEHSMRFLANPCKIWDSGRLDMRKIVLRLVFLDHLQYSHEKGFLNTKLSMPFSMLGVGANMSLENGAQGRI